MNDNIKYISIVLITLFFSVLFVEAQTWTAPTQTPPDGNTNPPLHEGGTAQSKVGGLLIATGVVTNGLIVQNGNVGIGTTSPGQKLDVNGYVKGIGVCIGSDCRTSWPTSAPSVPTGTISYCGINIYDINSTGSGWISYKYILCNGYLPYESAGTDVALGVPRGCPSGYFAIKVQSSTGANTYTCMTGLSTHPSYSSPLSPRTAFGPF